MHPAILNPAPRTAPTLPLSDSTSHSMGGGIAVIDQADFDNSRMQRIVLAEADVREIGPSTSLNLLLGGGVTSVTNMGCGVFVVDQMDTDTKRLQRVVLTKADLQAMLAWLA